MDELYRLSKSIDHGRTEQIDQANFIVHVKNIWEENSNKNIILKTMLENVNNHKFSLSDKNIDKIYKCELSRGDEFKILKNTVTNNSHYRNKFVEKEIPMSSNKFECLNIDKDVSIINYVNDNDLSNNKKSATQHCVMFTRT